MARYVLLSFSSNADAEYFVRANAKVVETCPFEVTAVYGKPTQHCDPSDGHRGKRSGNRRVVGYTRGKKFGWWVCTACGKPERPILSNPWATMTQARDLLPEILNPPEEVVNANTDEANKPDAGS